MSEIPTPDAPKAEDAYGNLASGALEILADMLTGLMA